jgi:hypothetical protein
MVGRDGLLKNARRHDPDVKIDADVIHEEDVFAVVRTEDGVRTIKHSYSGAPEARGKILGAWAEVRRSNGSVTFFVAPMSEYAPTDPKYTAWEKQPSVMITKVPISVCLRIAFSLSGVVSEEEGARMLEDDVSADAPTITSVAGLLPNDLIDRFLAAFEDADRTRPGQVTVAAAQMSTSGQPREAIVAYVERIERENRIAQQDAAEAEPPDAEVVADGPDIEALRHRLGSLSERFEAAEPASEEASALAEEIELVEAELRSAPPIEGQEAMDVA